MLCSILYFIVVCSSVFHTERDCGFTKVISATAFLWTLVHTQAVESMRAMMRVSLTKAGTQPATSIYALHRTVILPR